MRDLTIKHSKVLDNLFESQKRVMVLEGGSSSTKTWSIFQWIIVNCSQNRNESYTIARLKMTWTKATLLKDFETMVVMYGLPVTPDININRPDQSYRLWGNELNFIGLDEPQKAHGRRQDYLWLNEAMEDSEKEANQLMIRTKKRIFIDYNPAAESHWIYDNIISRPDCDFFHSTMRDNPFLEQSIIDELNRLENTDPVAYKIYNLGLRAVQRGLIFKNWEIVPWIPEGAKVIGYGLDFGYVNDPSALMRVCLLNGELWIDELIYERGLVNVPIRDARTGATQKNISDRMVACGLKGGYDEVIADSAEIKSIHELYAIGWNMKPAHKPKITFGLDILLRYKINITERSVNTIKEFKNYKWAVDKDGEPIRPEKPIDDFNHGIDAIRYVAVLKLSQRFQGIKRTN
jgi:phage terminase large subunit